MGRRRGDSVTKNTLCGSSQPAGGLLQGAVLCAVLQLVNIISPKAGAAGGRAAGKGGAQLGVVDLEHLELELDVVFAVAAVSTSSL